MRENHNQDTLCKKKKSIDSLTNPPVNCRFQGSPWAHSQGAGLSWGAGLAVAWGCILLTSSPSLQFRSSSQEHRESVEAPGLLRHRLATDCPVTLAMPTWAKPPRSPPRFKGGELKVPWRKDIDTEGVGNWNHLVIQSITMTGQYLLLSDLRDQGRKPKREWLFSIFCPFLHAVG